MATTSTRSTYPDWIYDGSPIDDPLGFGERAVKFLRLLKHPKSGLPFQLDPWQERIVRRIYGPRHEDGSRIVRTVVMLLPRGNRKTSLAAALGLLHTIGPEKVPGGEVITAASDRKQARIAYEEGSWRSRSAVAFDLPPHSPGKADPCSAPCRRTAVHSWARRRTWSSPTS